MDATLRDLERRARAGDLAARVAWRSALMRLRDPRRDPQPGDVLRLSDDRVRLIRKRAGERVIWAKWLRGEPLSTVCYKPGDRGCWIWSWWRWARHVEVVRLAEEREYDQATA